MIDLRCGDCLEVLPTLDAASVDAVVTDPPYGLDFMGCAWDHSVPGAPFWEAVRRVAKPGAHLLAFGGTRTFHRLTCAIEDAGWEIRDVLMWVYGQGWPKSTALLKPAWEPIILARKQGTGVLNIEACRVPVEGSRPFIDYDYSQRGRGNAYGEKARGFQTEPTTKGRWPANLIHDGSPEVVACFPETLDGNASRLFYCAKASPSDREDGNTHATVKPQALMRYLCRLVTPPGGLVLDPFMGSGTTGKAALSEGFRFVGVELEREHFDIAQRRLRGAQLGLGL